MSEDKQQEASAEAGASTPVDATIHPTPEPRFPRAAVRYVDALLDIQRQRFDKELTQANAPADQWQQIREQMDLPRDGQFFAEDDSFIGTGWSDLGHRRDGTAFRWMGRIGTLLVPLDFETGADIRIDGCGFTRRRHLKGLTVWLEQQPIKGTIARRGFNRWTFTGRIEPMAWRPYSILRLQAPGMSRLAVGLETFVSVAVSGISITALDSES